MNNDKPVVHGITNCDTVKRARAWLEDRGFEHRFHDFKREGVPSQSLDRWVVQLGWESLLNRQGTTWRKMPEGEKLAIVDADSARVALIAHPSLIRRPVVEWPDGQVTVGFTTDLFRRLSGTLVTAG